MTSSNEKKLTLNIVVIVILIVCLAVTTFALVFVSATLENNVIRTGKVAVNLNDGKPVITEDELVFEPGMTVIKKFFIENLTDTDAYYRLYFDNLSGELAGVLDVKICNGETVLYAGKATDLVFDGDDPPKVTDSILKKSDGRRALTISFHFPEGGANVLQDTDLKFDLVADAVQARNNSEIEFGDSAL